MRDFIDAHEWLTAYHLPPYAPDLNPVEGIWSVLRRTSQANTSFTDPDHLIHRLRHGLRQIQYRSDVIVGCLTATGLTLTTPRLQPQVTGSPTRLSPATAAMAPALLNYTADFVWPRRWWIAGADGRPPRESSRYERARVASLAVQNAVRAARTAPVVPDGTPAATGTATLTERYDQGEHDQEPPHAVDHSDRDAALPRSSVPTPSTPTSRPRCRRSNWRAVRPTRRRGCVPRRTSPGSRSSPWRPTPGSRLFERTQPDPGSDASAPAPVDQHQDPGPDQGSGATPRR